MKFPRNMINTEPRSPLELNDRVLFFGAFLEGLKFLEYHLKSTCLDSSTIIIRGPVGCGKKTLMKEVEELHLKKATVIYLDPYFLADDASALRFIKNRLGLPQKYSLQDVSQFICECEKKIVIVLLNFEIFCRNKQTLLYCVTEFVRNASNINLIGVTVNPDCTELVEKRVRSRLSPIFYDMSYPYRNINEYLEFASILLGNYNIKGLMREQLKFQYLATQRSIRGLKRYLRDLCLWTDRKLTIHQPPPTETACSRIRDQYLTARLSCLTIPQFELLYIALRYCKCKEEKFGMTLFDMEEFTRIRDYKFDSTSATTYKNLKFLVSWGLLRPLKSVISFSPSTKFTLGAITTEFNDVVAKHLKNDITWKLR